MKHYVLKIKKFLYECKKLLAIYRCLGHERRQDLIKLNQLRSKETIRVQFIAYKESQWKLTPLVHEMNKYKIFDVEIVICPDVRLTTWKTDYKNAKMFFHKVFGTDIVVKEYDAKDLVNLADIVFFTKPIDDVRSGSILDYAGTLKCYVPYSAYCDNNPKLQYNRLFHSKLWRH